MKIKDKNMKDLKFKEELLKLGFNKVRENEIERSEIYSIVFDNVIIFLNNRKDVYITNELYNEDKSVFVFNYDKEKVSKLIDYFRKIEYKDETFVVRDWINQEVLLGVFNDYEKMIECMKNEAKNRANKNDKLEYIKQRFIGNDIVYRFIFDSYIEIDYIVTKGNINNFNL